MASHRPVINTFTPAAAIGDILVLSGRNLGGATSVTIGGTAATNLVVLSETTLHCVVAALTSTGRVAVTTPKGTTVSKGVVTVIANAPTISYVSPLSGQAGDTVTVTGSDLTGASLVEIGGVAAGFAVESDTIMSVTVPAGAITGTLDVTTPGGMTPSDDTFTYVPTPVIFSVSPVRAPAGDDITISGSGLTGATVVTIGGTNAASFVVNDDTSITATLGSGTSGHVAVTNTHGTATSDASVTIVAAPTITSFTPAGGPPGTVVTITGTNLADLTGVSFNGHTAQIAHSTALTAQAIVPVTATTGHIAVTTPAGTVTSSDTFTTGPGPEIDYISPLSAKVGDTITVKGAGLTGATAVSLGGHACTGVSVGSDTSLTAVVASATPTGAVTVTTPVGSVSSEQQIVIEAAPTVASLAPTSGAAGAGILITGTHFDGLSGVSFNGHAAPFAVLSSTRIRASVPADATTGTVTVTNSVGTGTSASFTVT